MTFITQTILCVFLLFKNVSLIIVKVHFTNSKFLWSVTYRFREFHFPYMGIGNIDYIHSIKRLELLAFILTSYKIFKTCFQIKDILFMFMFIRNKLSMPI